MTLYGVADANIEYVNHLSTTLPTQAGFSGPGHSRVALGSGGLSGSRWGLRGTEDLGGSLKALFVLENGFGIHHGRQTESGRLLGRQAFVGLLSQRAGRQSFRGA